MATLTIDIFSDVVCPWCFVGTRRLAQVLESLDPPVDVALVHHPFLLDPSTPPGGVKIADRLREKYGRDPRAMFAIVESAARDTGIALDLSKQAYTYPTIAAHTLLRHAFAKGTQIALADALFVAHFQEARNIADVDVLVDVGTAHGFEADEVRRILGDEAELAATRREADQAAAGGIRGVPFFVFNQRLALSGAQPEAVFRDAIAQALDGASVSHA